MTDSIGLPGSPVSNQTSQVLSLERIEECESAFKKFSKNGVVPSKQLLQLLNHVGVETKDKAVFARMQQNNYKDPISLAEFVQIVSNYVQNKKREALMHESFKLGKKQKKRARELQRQGDSGSASNTIINTTSAATSAINSNGATQTRGACCVVC